MIQAIPDLRSKFKIIISNTGDVPLDVTVIDVLPPGLNYENHANPSEPHDIIGNTLYWYFTGSHAIQAHSIMVIDFHASMGECNIVYDNCVTVIGEYDCYEPVSDSDCAWVKWVNCEPPCSLGIRVDKYVKEDCNKPWNDGGVVIDLGAGGADWVTFKVEVKNTGDVPLDVTVRDELPKGLFYEDHASPREPDFVSGRNLYWYFDGVHDDLIGAGETVVIEFRAGMGVCDVKYTNCVYVTGEYDCCGPVDDSDGAWVKWDCCVEENEKPSVPCTPTGPSSGCPNISATDIW